MSVTDLAKAGAELAETVRKLIAPFLEPVSSEAGLYVAEKIRFVRFQNSLRVLEQASQLLANYGINPETPCSDLRGGWT